MHLKKNYLLFSGYKRNFLDILGVEDEFLRDISLLKIKVKKIIADKKCLNLKRPMDSILKQFVSNLNKINLEFNLIDDENQFGEIFCLNNNEFGIEFWLLSLKFIIEHHPIRNNNVDSGKSTGKFIGNSEEESKTFSSSDISWFKNNNKFENLEENFNGNEVLLQQVDKEDEEEKFLKKNVDINHKKLNSSEGEFKDIEQEINQFANNFKIDYILKIFTPKILENFKKIKTKNNFLKENIMYYSPSVIEIDGIENNGFSENCLFYSDFASIFENLNNVKKKFICKIFILDYNYSFINKKKDKIFILKHPWAAYPKYIIKLIA